MKKWITWTILIGLFAGLALLAGCGSPQSGSALTEGELRDPGKELASYTGTKQPMLVAKDGDTWFMLLNPFNTKGYSLSVSKDPAKPHVVYEGEVSVLLQNLAVGKGYAAWVENDGNYARVMLYDPAKGKVRELKKYVSEGNFVLNGKTYIQDGKLYFLVIDKDLEKLQIETIELASGREDLFYEQSVDLDAYYGCFALSEGKILVCADWASRKVLDLAAVDLKDGSVENVSLPKGINQVFDAEKQGDEYALYYHDDRTGREKYKGCDCIGLYTPGDEDIELVLSFTKNTRTYAFHDDIFFENGHLIWVFQWDSEDFGMQFLIYDFEISTKTTYTIEKGFGAWLDGNTLYSLTYDEEKDFDKVHLYVKDLNKK